MMPRAVRVGSQGQKNKLIAYKVIRRKVFTTAQVGVITAKSPKEALEQAQKEFWGEISTPVTLETEYSVEPIYSSQEYLALRQLGYGGLPSAWYGARLPGLPDQWWIGLKKPVKGSL